MREILFRWKNTLTKCWVYGHYYKNTIGMHNIVTNIGMTYEVDEKSIGQYTWLQDADWKKIFEWDIYTEASCSIGMYKVMFIEWAFVWGEDEESFDPLGYTTNCWVEIVRDSFCRDEIEVISNIYDNEC